MLIAWESNILISESWDKKHIEFRRPSCLETNALRCTLLMASLKFVYDFRLYLWNENYTLSERSKRCQYLIFLILACSGAPGPRAGKVFKTRQWAVAGQQQFTEGLVSACFGKQLSWIIVAFLLLDHCWTQTASQTVSKRTRPPSLNSLTDIPNKQNLSAWYPKSRRNRNKLLVLHRRVHLRHRLIEFVRIVRRCFHIRGLCRDMSWYVSSSKVLKTNNCIGVSWRQTSLTP